VLQVSAARVITVQEIDDSFMMYTKECWLATCNSTMPLVKSTC